MRITIISEDVVLNTNRFFRSYSSAEGTTEADNILIDNGSESRLLVEALMKKLEARGRKPIGAQFIKEEAIVTWPNTPIRLGRVSSKIVGEGLFTHEEAEVLPAQLNVLRERKPTKKHFRFAVINGFGTGLGDNTIGITAFRVIAEYLGRWFKSFSVDILFGLDTNPACSDIVGHETWVDQVLFNGPTLADFAQYDAYFDTTGIIKLPKYGEIPSVDWYLWWFGLDPDQVPQEKKRNKGHIRWNAWNAVRKLLKEASGKKVLFSPKASTPLRTMPLNVAANFAKCLLELDPELKLVIDQALDIKHKRLIDLSGKIDSVEKFKVLISQVDGLISVDSFAPHFADTIPVPCVTIFSSVPANIYPYYPLSKPIELPGIQDLPGYRKFKVSPDEWKNIKDDYIKAWQRLDPKKILQELITLIKAKETSITSFGVQLISDHHVKSCVKLSGRIWRLERQRCGHEFENSQNHIAQLVKLVLKSGTISVLAGAGVPKLALSLAQQVGSQGRVHVFEPRRILAQLLSGSLAQAGFFNTIVHNQMPIEGFKKADIPDLTPWSESSADEWGNCISKISVDTLPIDALALKYCHALIIQPPMPFVMIIKGALNTLKRCRPLILISPISIEDAGPVCKVALGASYNFWAEPASQGSDMSKILLLGVPSESKIEIKNFIKIEVNNKEINLPV